MLWAIDTALTELPLGDCLRGPKRTGAFKVFTSHLTSDIDSTRTMTKNSGLSYEECS